MTYVAKGTPGGYDVKTAAGFLQSFNSSWPHLKIEHSDTATITENSTHQTIYTHGLGYPPLYFIIHDGQFYASAGLGLIGVNNSELAYTGYTFGGGASFSFRYYVCRLPLTQNFTAPVVAASEVKTAVSHDYVIKLSLPGKSIESNDLRDFSMHTATRSLMIHKVDYGAVDAGTYMREVQHGLPYTPIGFAYVKFGAGGVGTYNPDYHYIVPPPIGVQDASYTIDSTIMTIIQNSASLSASGYGTAVILKDPFYKDAVNITYP